MLVLHRSASNCVRIQRVHRRNISVGQFNFCQTQTTKFFLFQHFNCSLSICAGLCYRRPTSPSSTSQWPPADNCQLFMTRVNGRETDDVKKMTDDFAADVSRCAVDCHNEPDLHMLIRSRDKALAVHAVFHTLLLAICVNRSCCARMPAHFAQMAGRETRR